MLDSKIDPDYYEEVEDREPTRDDLIEEWIYTLTDKQYEDYENGVLEYHEDYL